MSEQNPQNNAGSFEGERCEITQEQQTTTEMQELRRFVSGVCGVIGDFVKTELSIRRGDY